MTRRSALPQKDESTEDREYAGDGAPRPTSQRAEAERHLTFGPDTIQRANVFPHRKLAAAVVASCVEILKERKPRTTKAILAWENRRRDETAFIVDAKASAFWCEAAGVEWDVVISKLRAQKLLAA